MSSRFAEIARNLGTANFLYCDGTTLFVHAHERHQMDGEVTPGLTRDLVELSMERTKAIEASREEPASEAHS